MIAQQEQQHDTCRKQQRTKSRHAQQPRNDDQSRYDQQEHKGLFQSISTFISRTYEKSAEYLPNFAFISSNLLKFARESTFTQDNI